jgi:hypothetical protein
LEKEDFVIDLLAVDEHIAADGSAREGKDVAGVKNLTPKPARAKAAARAKQGAGSKGVKRLLVVVEGESSDSEISVACPEFDVADTKKEDQKQRKNSLHPAKPPLGPQSPAKPSRKMTAREKLEPAPPPAPLSPLPPQLFPDGGSVATGSSGSGSGGPSSSSSSSSGPSAPPPPPPQPLPVPPPADLPGGDAADGRAPEHHDGKKAPVAIRGPRKNRSVPWGPFHIAEVWNTVGDKMIGWGATCGQHSNHGDVDQVCKKMITFGESDFTSDDLRVRMKRWLVFGLGMDNTAGDARHQHVKENARKLVELSEEDLDNIAANLG